MERIDLCRLRLKLKSRFSNCNGGTLLVIVMSFLPIVILVMMLGFQFRNYSYFEKIDEHKSKIIGTCLYPSILILCIIGNLIAMSIKVIPVFRQLFEGYERELPLITKKIFLLRIL